MNVAIQIIERGINFAAKAGWPSEILNFGTKSCHLKVSDRHIVLQLDKPADEVPQTEDVHILYLPPSWRIAFEFFQSTLACVSGHATILAPVGGYKSLLEIGAIDAVVLSPSKTFDSSNWTFSFASIGHTRCWIINLIAQCPTILDERTMLNTLASSDRLVIPAKWLGIRDTATLCEFARDMGWADASYPYVVVLNETFCRNNNNSQVNVWLAVTDAVVSMQLAEQIGAIVSPTLPQSQRFIQLNQALNSGLRGRL
ncbi:hypothetical protein RBA63_01530 [Brenneria goodwinii]|uniref:hypothetical protein n=1 Tax=Brenneria goodwinii TaxID=1109412 RepID=UPI0036E3C32B